MPRKSRVPSPERVMAHVIKAYPGRRCVVKAWPGSGVFVSVSAANADPTTRVFSLTISDDRDIDRQIERARKRAEKET